MPDRSTLWLIGAIGVILLLAAVVRTAVSDGEAADPRASTHLNTPAGGRAFHVALEMLGVEVERHHAPFEAGRMPKGPLVLFDPLQPLSPAEGATLREWVEEGGTLFLLGTAAGVPAGLLASVSQSAPDGASDRLFTRSKAGSGTVYRTAEADAFRNLRLHDSAEALHRFVELARPYAGAKRPLTFGEYHHGFREGGSPLAVMVRFATTTPVGMAMLYLFAVLLLAILTAGFRFGAPLGPAPARRRDPLEHAGALARIYHQANARRHACEVIARSLLRRLSRPSKGPLSEEIYALRTRSPAAAGLARRIRATLEADDPNLVALTTDTDDLYREWTEK